MHGEYDMGLPGRRELAVYRLVLELGEANLGTVIDKVSKELCMTRKTARNIIKYLAKIGALEVIKYPVELSVRARDPREFLEALTSGYISSRRERCRDR